MQTRHMDMMTPQLRCITLRMLVLNMMGLLVCAPSTVHALRADYGLGVGAEYSDNIALVETDEQDDVGLSLFAGFSLEHSAAELDADVRGGIEYTDYTNDVFSDETLGSLRADVEWRPIPGVLHWTVEDYFTQTLRDSIAPETPANRINANAFSTGPDFFLRLGPATTFETHLRRAEYYFEDTDADSSRNMLSLAWVRALRPQLDVSANLAYEEANFTQTDSLDFDRFDYFLRGVSRRGRSELAADIGATRVDRESGDDIDGFLGRLLLRRQVGVNTQLDLEASSQYTDSGVDLLTAGAAPFTLDRSNEQISGDVFNDRRIEARYRTGTADRNWSAYIQLRDEDYDTLLRDRETRAVRLDFHRNISASLFLNGYALLRREEYTDVPLRTDNDAEYSLGLERRMSRTITARLDYAYNTRDSSIAGFDYDENRIVFLIYYGSNPSTFR